MKHNIDNPALACCILAGGKSSRFGSNKALAIWPPGNHTVIEAVIAAASQVTADITIITDRPEEYSFTGLPCRPDLFKGGGPVSGIHAALCHASTDRILALACDMPAVSGHFLQWLASLFTWAPAVIPESDHGPEPLHAMAQVTDSGFRFPPPTGKARWPQAYIEKNTLPARCSRRVPGQGIQGYSLDERQQAGGTAKNHGGCLCSILTCP